MYDIEGSTKRKNYEGTETPTTNLIGYIAYTLNRPFVGGFQLQTPDVGL